MTTIELHWYSAPPIAGHYLLQDTLDLFDGTDGLRMAYNGLTRAVGDREAVTVKETFTLRADGADFDDLAAVLQALDLWQQRIAWSLNETDLHEVWLYMQMGDETNGLEAQVLDLQYSIGDDLLNYSEPHINQLTIVLTRTIWEDDKAQLLQSLTFADAALGATAVGMEPYPKGDLPARIDEMLITSSAALQEFWLALQTDQMRDIDSFDPIWPLSEAGSEGGLVSHDTDTDTISGTRVTITNMGDYGVVSGTLTITVDDVDQVMPSGHFEILLRAKNSAVSTETHVRIGYGWARPLRVASQTTWRDLVPVTSLSYKLYDMQSIAIPPTELTGDYGNVKIELEVTFISGAGDLHLDFVGLLPLDEGAIHVISDAALGSNKGILVTVAPNGQRSCAFMEDGNPADIVMADAEIWRLPANNTGVSLVAFAQRDTVCQLADTLTVDLDYAQRWRLLRGAT